MGAQLIDDSITTTTTSTPSNDAAIPDPHDRNRPHADKKKRRPRPPETNHGESSGSVKQDSTAKHTRKPSNKKQQEESKPEAAAQEPNHGESSETASKQQQQRPSRRRPQRKPTAESSNKKKEQEPKPKITKDRAQARLTTTTPDDVTATSIAANDEGKKKHKKKKRAAKQQQQQQADDLATTLARELKASEYECMVCWDVIRPAHPTWSCDRCWAVFHLPCVQKWATRSLQDTDTNRPVTAWRCPGCQHTRTAVPKDYLCFCGKQLNPNENRHLTTPHSCGQLCKRARPNCPHPCVLPCHPGPCPPCHAMGPLLTCFCGRHQRQSKCSETDYTARAFSCDDPCAELLGCEQHVCREKCHPGLCPPCPEKQVQKCYCGRQERLAACGSGYGVPSGDRIGFFECKAICDRLFACGQHRCRKACHPQDEKPNTCPFDPALVKSCPCGSTTIPASARKACTDPIPTCDSLCRKPLRCGQHTCPEKCHTGACPPCQEKVKVPCRCRSTEFEAVCSNGQEQPPPLCDKTCRAMRSCGRHPCGTKCCPAAMKQKKGSTKKSASSSDRAHECPMTCGRTLSCGKHACQAKCHKGACPPCLEAVFEEVSCHCGRTRLDPPVRCGTALPPCPHPCVRVPPCGHVRLLQHNCHPDNEPCPPCVILVTRRCVCGKMELKNVPCHRESPRCGRICDQPLGCGRHRCQKTCHTGACLSQEEGEECAQPCGGERPRCGHPCTARCHGREPCSETEPCPTRIRVRCKCGQNSLVIPCNATHDSDGSKRELECNDFCAKVERNRKLAMALELEKRVSSNENNENASSLSLTSDELGYYDESLCEFYRNNLGWCKQIEARLIEFVQDGTKQTWHCKPMKSAFRRFVHRYCVHFNLTTEAVDREPYRSVVVRKTPGQQCRIPSPLLSVAAHHPTMNRPPPPATVVEEPPPATVAAAAAIRKKHPVNALCLSDLAFGLIKTELDLALRQALGDAIPFHSEWLTDAEAVIVTPAKEAMDVEEKEALVWHMKKRAKDAMAETGHAARVDCCWVNRHGKITWTERKSLLLEAKEEEQGAGTAHKNLFEALVEDQQEGDDEEEGWTRLGKKQQQQQQQQDDDDVWPQEAIVVAKDERQPATVESSHHHNNNTPKEIEEDDDWEILATE